MTDHGWTGARASALGRALRLTCDGFAARLGVAPRTVANWRRNPEMVPRLSVWDLLDDLLANASDDARKRFKELTGPNTAGRIATSPEDVLGLFEAIDDVYAQQPGPEEEDEWALPPGAKGVDCVAFGAMDSAVKDLINRVAVLERRVLFLADKLLDAQAR